MKKFINYNILSHFIMKLNKNEKFTLKLMLSNPEVPNMEIAKHLNITTQAVGKIKKKLISKGVFNAHELKLDYEKMGISVFVVALIKIMPRAFKKFKAKELDQVLQPLNVIHSFTLPQTNVTHIIIYGFRNVDEYDTYFRTLQTKLGEFIEIRESYVFSPKSILKSSSKELFLNALEEHDKEETPKLDITELIDS